MQDGEMVRVTKVGFVRMDATQRFPWCKAAGYLTKEVNMIRFNGRVVEGDPYDFLAKIADFNGEILFGVTFPDPNEEGKKRVAVAGVIGASLLKEAAKKLEMENPGVKFTIEEIRA